MLLVFPRVGARGAFEGFDYHLGAAYVRAFLGAAGRRTRQFLHPGGGTLTEMARRILEEGRDASVIGFSCYDSNVFLVRLLADELRRLGARQLLICGGPSATFSDEAILEGCPALDACVRGYGEETALDILEWSFGNRKPSEIAGLTFRDRDGRVLRTESRPLPADDLDRYPDPYLSSFLPAERAADLGVLTSRGCTFPCVFCNCAAMSGRTVRYHSPDRVLEVLSFLNDRASQAAGNRMARVAIVDDNFSLNGPRFHAILERLAVMRLDRLEFWAEMRVESLREDSFILMKRAGFRDIHFGLESAVPRVLAALGKVRNADDSTGDYARETAYVRRIDWAVQRAKEAGLEVSVSVLFGGPGETEADGMATLSFVRDIKATRYAHNYLRVLPGTPLATNADRYGLRVSSLPGRKLPWRTHHAYDVTRLPVLKNDEAMLPRSGRDIQEARRLITGLRHTTATGEQAGPAPIHVVFESGLQALSPAAWLQKAMPLRISVWLTGQDASDPDTFLARLAADGAPVGGLNTLRPSDPGSRPGVWRINESAPTAPDGNTRRVMMRPLSEKDPAKAPDDRCHVVWMIESHADLAQLRERGRAMNAQTGWTYPVSWGHSPMVRDACRWCAAPCPASAGGRWLVGPSGEVRPCWRGKVVGQVGDTLQHLTRAVETLAEAARKRRGCATCPAAARCSQCLFPLVDDAEYCAFRLEGPEATDWITGISFLTALPPDARPRFKRLSGFGKTIMRRAGYEAPVEECLLAATPDGANAILAHARSMTVFELNAAEHALLELAGS